MSSEPALDFPNDFEYMIGFLPAGWQDKAKELGALRRCRKIPDAETLLRVFLIHLAEGCSLRQTSVRAREGGIVSLSDVAILDRLKQAGEWFRWINTELMNNWVVRPPATVFGDEWNIKLVDGTRIKEPGPTGSSWCIHYAIGLPSLECSELRVCGHRGPGESLVRFTVKPGDLFVGDRAYGVRPGIWHVVKGGGDVLVRFAMSNLPLQAPGGGVFNLIAHLRALRGTKIGDWPVELHHKEHVIAGRVCAIRKNHQAVEKAQQQVRRQAQKNGSKPRPETLEAAAYIFVFTTVKPPELRPSAVLEMYRGRWQIELVFKRLKSILGLGHLRKHDIQAAQAWIEGKLLVAFLVESLICAGESFFPWGYPLCETSRPKPVPLA